MTQHWKPPARPWHAIVLLTLLIPSGAVLRAAASEAAMPAEAPPSAPKPIPEPNAAGFALYRSLVQDAQFLPEDGNLVLSPASLEPILHALWLASRGQTAAELEHVLDLVPPPSGDAKPQIRPVSPQLREAAALWLAQNWQPRPDYLAAVQPLGMTPRFLDFAQNPSAATDTVNAWVRERTEGQIQQLFQPADLGGDTRLVLASALAYDGSWDMPFKPEFTTHSSFHTVKKSKAVQVRTAFMRQLATFPTAEAADGTRVLVLPLASGAQRCVLLLPPAGKFPLRQLATLEKQLTPAHYQSLTASLEPRSVDLHLPRLALTVRASIRAALQRLGVRRLFEPRLADLGGLSDEAGLCVSVLRHETRLELDEAGARGTAATGAAIATRGLPPRPLPLVFDRPFVFAIEEITSGRLIFLGRMLSPMTDVSADEKQD